MKFTLGQEGIKNIKGVGNSEGCSGINILEALVGSEDRWDQARR